MASKSGMVGVYEDNTYILLCFTDSVHAGF